MKILLSILIFVLLSCVKDNPTVNNQLLISFTLLNESDINTSDFEVSEGILLQLKFENQTDEDILMDFIFLNDTFSVFDANNLFIGNFYNNINIDKIANLNLITSKTSLSLKIPWLTQNNYYNFGHFHFIKDSNVALTKGIYFLKHTSVIYYISKSIEYKENMSINLKFNVK